MGMGMVVLLYSLVSFLLGGGFVILGVVKWVVKRLFNGSEGAFLDDKGGREGSRDVGKGGM